MGAHPGLDTLLGGAVLVAAFALLHQRRLVAVIDALALQAWAVAATAAWQSWAQRSAAPGFIGLFVLAANGVAIPLALRRGLRDAPAEATTPGGFPTLAAGAALVALAVLLAIPAAMDTPWLARENLALALSVVLLGLLMLVCAGAALVRVVGFVAMANGLLLALVDLRGLPLAVPASLAVIALAGTVAAGVVFLGLRERDGEPR